MTRGRPSEDCPPEDPPDWFDAGGAQDAMSASDGGDGHDGVRAGEWFDDPDHRPIETVPESPDEPTEEPSNPVANGGPDGEVTATDVPGVTDEEGTGVDTPAATAGTTDGSPTPADETSERTGPASADVADGGGGGVDEGGSTPDGPGSGADESGSAGGGSEAVTVPPRPDECGGTAVDTDTPADGVDAEGAEDEVDETDATDAEETDATASVVGRILAYLRSIIGRMS